LLQFPKQGPGDSATTGFFQVVIQQAFEVLVSGILVGRVSGMEKMVNLRFFHGYDVLNTKIADRITEQLFEFEQVGLHRIPAHGQAPGNGFDPLALTV